MTTNAAGLYRCLVCGFDVEVDDARFVTERGTCICLRCFYREVGGSKQPTAALRREVEDAEGQGADGL